ncbi:hypothetical protein OCU04_004538 [Sclerotinia nivalis]|uniref:Uncharacterized protein n=1 Tax=Sclerotinia nivalis TaxID=352851 RepID=A0A9X0DKQ7_9HELO|nr:hypothetical protein OCU04_004538 [Sclerotinia nivalis]
METADELLFSRQWRSRVGAVYDSLERDDVRYISVYNSWKDAHEQIVAIDGDVAHPAVSHELNMLLSAAKSLKLFVESFLTEARPTLETSIFWGLLRLIVKVSFKNPLY